MSQFSEVRALLKTGAVYSALLLWQSEIARDLTLPILSESYARKNSCTIAVPFCSLRKRKSLVEGLESMGLKLYCVEALSTPKVDFYKLLGNSTLLISEDAECLSLVPDASKCHILVPYIPQFSLTTVLDSLRPSTYKSIVCLADDCPDELLANLDLFELVSNLKESGV